MRTLLSIIMFHFMLCSSFLCFDKAFVLTSDKREPETKGQRVQDYRKFVILKPEFIIVHLQHLLQCSGTKGNLFFS